jgi:hypothetical protein
MGSPVASSFFDTQPWLFSRRLVLQKLGIGGVAVRPTMGKRRYLCQK